MLSPSPTQPPPSVAPELEKKTVTSTPIRRRFGKHPVALFLKGIFRPIIKGIYYLIIAIRKHAFITVALIVVFLAAYTIASFSLTGAGPLGIGGDPFNQFNIHGGGASDQVKSWLYALRDGDVSTLTSIENGMYTNIKPDPLDAIDRYSQAKTHLTWKSISVLGVHGNGDGTVDGVVQINLSSNTPGGPVLSVLIWHIVVYNAQTISILYSINLVDFRSPIPGSSNF